MSKQLVVIENQTSSGVLSPTELKVLIETAQLYAQDINYSPWVEHKYINPVEVKLLQKGETFPKGAYNLILLDEISLEGALGYHEDEGGGKIPVSYVPVKEIREDDATVTEVLTHELGEMVVDPWIENPRIVLNDNKEYIVEIADPLQELSYKLKNGQLAADFVWPRWFGLPQTRPNVSQIERISVASPFEICATGYISIKEPGQEWKQIMGERINRLPKWASRLPRIHGTLQ